MPRNSLRGGADGASGSMKASSNLGAITPAGGVAIELYSTNTKSRKPS